MKKRTYSSKESSALEMNPSHCAFRFMSTSIQPMRLLSFALTCPGVAWKTDLTPLAQGGTSIGRKLQEQRASRI
jgi:hypothetical protein